MAGGQAAVVPDTGVLLIRSCLLCLPLGIFLLLVPLELTRDLSQRRRRSRLLRLTACPEILAQYLERFEVTSVRVLKLSQRVTLHDAIADVLVKRKAPTTVGTP